MAYVKANPLLGELRGKIGDLTITKYGDKYIIKKLPERKHRPPTQAQMPVRQNLVNANDYWRRVKAQPELKAVYVLAARVQRKRAIDLAKSDFLNAPTVTDIDLSGYIGQPAGVIRVKAEDDLEAATVRVRVLELEGAVIEEGDAALAPNPGVRKPKTETNKAGGIWAYASKAAVPAGKAVVIEVTAADRAGNKTVKRVDHVCGVRN
jgi:hypothetical protein